MNCSQQKWIFHENPPLPTRTHPDLWALLPRLVPPPTPCLRDRRLHELHGLQKPIGWGSCMSTNPLFTVRHEQNSSTRLSAPTTRTVITEDERYTSSLVRGSTHQNMENGNRKGSSSAARLWAGREENWTIKGLGGGGREIPLANSELCWVPTLQALWRWRR